VEGGQHFQNSATLEYSINPGFAEDLHHLRILDGVKCTQPGCPWKQSFITESALSHHLEIVHNVKVEPKTMSFKCASTNFRNPDKELPRLKLKRRIRRMLGDEDPNDLIAG